MVGNISIEKIKAYRAATGCSLREAHDAIAAGREVPTKDSAPDEMAFLDRIHSVNAERARVLMAALKAFPDRADFGTASDYAAAADLWWRNTALIAIAKAAA